MPNTSEVLVLVADDDNAMLYANSNGVTRLLRTIDRVPTRNSLRMGANDGESSRYDFACELMMALGRGAREQSCDGVVIFAEAPMMEELRRVQTSNIARLVIAQIVGRPSQPGQFAGLSAANAQMVQSCSA